MDKKIKETAVLMLENILVDQSTIDMTGRHLYKLVNEEEFIKVLMTDIFINLLREGIDFNRETR